MTTAELTEEELDELLDEITDDHTRALDSYGWKIVPKTIEPGDGIRKWPCAHPAPSWCEDLSALSANRETRRVVELEQALRLIKDRLMRAAGSTSDEATKRDLEALLFEVAAARP